MTNIIVWFYNLRQSRWFWLILGALLGLILGLVVGPQVFKTTWIDATPYEMRLDFRDTYLAWVAQEYEQTQDLDLARQRLFGADYAKADLPDWYKTKINETLYPTYLKRLEEVAQARAQAGDPTAVSLSVLRKALQDGGKPARPTGGAGGGGILSTVMPICVVLLVLLFLGGGAFFIYRFLARRREEGAGEAVAERMRPVQPAVWGVEEVPLAQYPTTYTLGDDHYDPSFSIEMRNGEFMGECGVGISETIGVGAPSKVTAFEVWLFDKSDIRTVTRVLMSDYAYHDDALRTKLAPKGEPVLVEEGQEVVLETKTLRVTARIVEAQYGVGNLPPNSFFERLSIDLIAWVKPLPEGAELVEPVDFDAPVSYG